MTTKEAIEILQDSLKDNPAFKPALREEAIKLGIQALQTIGGLTLLIDGQPIWKKFPHLAR